MCCALKHGRHYCSSRVELNTFTPGAEAEMFGLITVGSRPLRQVMVICAIVEVVLS